MGNKNMKKIKIEGFTNSSNSQLNELNENLKKISLSKNEKSSSNEEEKNLKIVKKHNKESQDAKLIDECLSKHFFFLH